MKNNIARMIIAPLILIIFISISTSYLVSISKASAQDQPLDYWTITVVKAEGLKNKDWGVNRVSDPYVEVRGITTRGGSLHDTMKDLNKGTRMWDTHVKSNSLNPVWDETFRWIPPSENFGGLYLQFWVWDEDPAGRAFLGKAVLGYAKEGVYRMRLTRRFGSRPMPGILTVSIKHIVEAKVVVPKLIGMNKQEVIKAVHGKGLKLKLTVSYTKTTTPDHGRIYDQYPKPGDQVLKGSTVNIFQHLPQVKIMPNIKGLPLWKARRRTSFLIHPLKQIYVTASPQHPEKWFRVVRQSVPVGTKIPLDKIVTATITRPTPGTKVIMPDLRGMKVYEAAKKMSEEHIGFTWKRQESSLKDNGRIVAQEPEPDTKVAFDNPKAVSLYIGHYSDGLSYFSAKPVNPGQIIEMAFDKQRITQFRRVKVKKAGYLVLHKIDSPFSIKCNFYNSRSPVPLGREDRFFDQAIRVTPGTWVFSVFPEFRHDTSPKPVKLKVDLVEEFDSAEPNNSPEAATLVSPNARLELGYIGTNDKDFYRFEVKQPGFVTIKDLGPLKKTDHSVTPQMSLYGPKHQSIYEGPTEMAKWLWPGLYYVSFYCEGSAENFDTVPYGIDITFTQDTDKIEPNNTLSDATPVKVPARVAMRFETRGKDYFLLKSDEPGYVVVSSPEKLPFPVKLWPINEEGSEQRAKLLPCAIRINKEARIKIAQEMPADFKVDRSTNLDFMFIPGKEDIFEPNDTVSEAKPIMLGKDIQALSMPASDRDFYRFQLKSPDLVTLMIARKGTKCPLVGRLYDKGGREISKDLIYFPLRTKLQAGEYVLEVVQENGLQGLHVAPYVLRVFTESTAPPVNNLSNRYQIKDKKDARTRKGIELAERAYILYLKRKYEEAANLYIEASHLIPTSPAVWNDLGACYFNLNHFDKAKENFKKATVVSPTYSLAWRNLGVAARKNGDHAKSIEYSKKAAALEPSAKNLGYAGYALLVAGVATKDKAKQEQLFRDSLAYFEKSLQKERNPEVQKRVNALKKYLQ